MVHTATGSFFASAHKVVSSPTKNNTYSAYILGYYVLFIG